MLIAIVYLDIAIGSQAVTQLPWGHIITVIQKVKPEIAREWYIRQCIRNSWARNALIRNINQNLYERQGVPENKQTNFYQRLPVSIKQLACCCVNIKIKWLQNIL